MTERTGAVALDLQHEDVQAAGAFVSRVLTQDARAAVRLRSLAAGERVAVNLACWLPYDVLVSRSVLVGESVDLDRTLSAAELLAALDTVRRSPQPLTVPLAEAWWSGSLAPATGWEARETVPAERVTALASQAAAELKQAAGSDPRALQQVGNTLLDQEVVTVHDRDEAIAIPLRLVVAAVRMGFLADRPARVSTTPGWLRLDGAYGWAAVRRQPDLLLLPA